MKARCHNSKTNIKIVCQSVCLNSNLQFSPTKCTVSASSLRRAAAAVHTTLFPKIAACLTQADKTFFFLVTQKQQRRQPPGCCNEEVADTTEGLREGAGGEEGGGGGVGKTGGGGGGRRRRRRVMGGKQAVGRQLHAVVVFSGRELSSAYTALSLSLPPSLSLPSWLSPASRS